MLLSDYYGGKRIELNYFVPFDIICGCDHLPDDKWWVTSRQIKTNWDVQDISSFIPVPTKSFSTAEKAIEFATDWWLNWIKNEQTRIQRARIRN